jgi:branched-subunit amino acid transport protein
MTLPSPFTTLPASWAIGVFDIVVQLSPRYWFFTFSGHRHLPALLRRFFPAEFYSYASVTAQWADAVAE